MDVRLASWKSNMLSLAARHTLVSSVASAMPSTPLQMETCNEIDKHRRSFLWGSTSSSHKPHLVSWYTECNQKEDGGLGLQQARYQNWAFMTKLDWALINK
ncbi:hypothetical protein K1719_027686 [Acacia pycnantha]|nr:hypothetical protein K1719_027686 [Acacia pycnantha]